MKIFFLLLSAIPFIAYSQELGVVNCDSLFNREEDGPCIAIDMPKPMFTSDSIKNDFLELLKTKKIGYTGELYILLAIDFDGNVVCQKPLTQVSQELESVIEDFIKTLRFHSTFNKRQIKYFPVKLVLPLIK